MDMVRHCKGHHKVIVDSLAIDIRALFSAHLAVLVHHIGGHLTKDSPIRDLDCLVDHHSTKLIDDERLAWAESVEAEPCPIFLCLLVEGFLCVQIGIRKLFVQLIQRQDRSEERR